MKIFEINYRLICAEQIIREKMPKGAEVVTEKLAKTTEEGG